MRKSHLVGALAGVLALAVAVTAYAVPSSQTTFDVNTKVSPSKAGTKRKPKIVKYTLGIVGGTTTGQGSPETSTELRIRLPKTLKWRGAKWPRKRRCSASKAISGKTNKVCPKGSKVGSGNVVATATVGTARIVEPIKLTAYVLTDTHLGLWITASRPVTVATMLKGTVRGASIIVKIPKNVQEPVRGIATGIEKLSFTLNGTTRIKRRKRGALESEGCPRGGYKTTVTNVYRTKPNRTDSATAKCRK